MTQPRIPFPRFLLSRPVLWAAGLVLVSAAAACENSSDEVLKCTVRSVHDGDSMRVRCPGNRQNVRVRLHQIDAPELEQPYGKRAGDQLRQLCPVGREVTLKVHGEDQYGRLLGDAECGGKNVNREMVASGAAWAYERYVQDSGLPQLQKEAQQARRGLWSHGNPEAPWQWRYHQRQGD